MKVILSLFVMLAFAGAVSAKDVTREMRPTRFSATEPVLSKSVWQFDLRPDKCNPQEFGDGRGESMCGGGRRASLVNARRHIRPGQAVEYGFEIFIPKDFVYDGDRSFPAFSRLVVAEWKRERGIKNHLYDMQLESRRGATFERQVCFKPSEFGKWNSFKLRINWSGGADGYMQAICNGKVVLSRRGAQTLIPPDCGAEYKLQCDPAKQKPKEKIMWVLGPNLAGYGRDFAKLRSRPSSPFPPFPPHGVKFQVRNVTVTPIR